MSTVWQIVHGEETQQAIAAGIPVAEYKNAGIELQIGGSSSFGKFL